MAGDEPRIIASFDSYEGMLDTIRERMRQLQVAGTAFDQFCGLPLAYTQKIIGPRPIRRLGMSSFGPVLNGLGLRCLFVEDPEGTERLKSRVPPRNGSYVRGGATHLTLTTRFMQKIGRLGARARIDNSTAEQRQKWARAAANARWGKANR